MAALVCYVGFYGEKHGPCQTGLVQGIKKRKKKKHVQGGEQGELHLNDLMMMWNHRKTQQKEVDVQHTETLRPANRKAQRPTVRTIVGLNPDDC